MHIDQLRDRFPDDVACRQFLEGVMWADGRLCPGCRHDKSYAIRGESARAGLYECARCKRQFTVTTNTPFHGKPQCQRICRWRYSQQHGRIIFIHT
ncbi:MAG: hypothetical protein CMM60_00055 [Rhodospirillaceae bacterium]|nr:hypothetical protein [Rhodospirillaceae bacterium]